MLKGAKSISYAKDQVIVAQDENFQRIYQISRGRCRIEVIQDDKPVVLGWMGAGETFGEVSILVLSIVIILFIYFREKTKELVLLLLLMKKWMFVSLKDILSMH